MLSTIFKAEYAVNVLKLSAYIHYILSPQRLRSLLSKGISVQTAMSALSYFQRNRALPPTPQGPAPTQAEVENALKPLYVYFNENFAIMKQTLTDTAMIMVMTRLWKEVLLTIEALLVPPLSDKPSSQRQLSRQEMDIVFKWLQVGLLLVPNAAQALMRPIAFIRFLPRGRRWRSARCAPIT